MAVHPRVGGERFNRPEFPECCRGSSPRGRGTQPNATETQRGARFIPAWAGNAYAAPDAACQVAVHPRVGGERFPMPPRMVMFFGSSPRGRGTRQAHPGMRPQQRFIPAWAGNAVVPRPPY